MCKENCENHPERGYVCSDKKCFDKGGTCVYQVPSNNPDDYMKPEQDQDQIQDEVVHQPEIFHEHPEVIDQEEPEFEVGGEGDFIDHVPDSIPEGSIPDNGKCPDGFDLYFDYGLAEPEPICLPIGTYDGDYATIPPANDEFDDNEIPE